MQLRFIEEMKINKPHVKSAAWSHRLQTSSSLEAQSSFDKELALTTDLLCKGIV
jgi:hypothetical protein